MPNSSRIHTNRFHADPGNLTAQVGAAVNPFRPFTQVVEVSAASEPWTPLLPAGLSVLDGLVCDGAGCNYNFDINGSLTLDPLEVLAVEDARFGNAAGFSGRGTRGLININTAPVEVLRTLPHLSRLVYNDNDVWPGTALAEGGPDGWQGYIRSNPLSGDVDDRARPSTNLFSRNVQYARVAEVIDRYRTGGGVFNGGVPDSRRLEQIGSMPGAPDIAVPYYDDRGTFDYNAPGQPFAAWVSDNIVYPTVAGTPGLFPGMRRGAGFVSVGELALMDRVGVTSPAFGSSWPKRSASISGAALDPYSFQGMGASNRAWDPTVFGPDVNTRLGLGWRPPAGSGGLPDGPASQTDARLSTDRRHIAWRRGLDTNGNLRVVEIPDSVAGDAEEANLLFAGLSNLVSVRSDVFTVYLKIRSFRQNPVTGVWSAADPEFVVDESRYVFVVDRSRCQLPGDEPEVRLFSKVPN